MQYRNAGIGPSKHLLHLANFGADLLDLYPSFLHGRKKLLHLAGKLLQLFFNPALLQPSNRLFIIQFTQLHRHFRKLCRPQRKLDLLALFGQLQKALCLFRLDFQRSNPFFQLSHNIF